MNLFDEYLLVNRKLNKYELAKYKNEFKSSLNSSGKSFYEVLIEYGILTEKELVDFFEKNSEVYLVDISNLSIEKNVLEIIPGNVAKEHGFIPFKLFNDTLYIAMKDPMDLIAIEKAKDYSRLDLKIFVSYPSAINRAISNFYGIETADKAILEMSKSIEDVDLSLIQKFDLKDNENEDEHATNRYVNSIIKRAISDSASDIHIEAFEEYTITRIRVDGVLREIQKSPISLHESIVARIKVMGNMDVAERRIPQDGRSSVSMKGEDFDLRISSLPTVYGEKIVIRLLKKSVDKLEKSAIGLKTEDELKYEKILSNHNGVILIVGPTGSGKSTTMVTMIKSLNNKETNIVTLEDPVEYEVPGVNQVQINEKTGMTFSKGLRSIMRQDPDIICVGEIRDGETAEIAMRAAITGHLVISTLHTNDAISSFERLSDMGVPSYLNSSAIIGVISQRLVRKICPYCKEESIIDEKALDGYFIDVNKCYKGKGCPMCYNTGYLGRTGVFEILVMNSRIRRAITNGASSEDLALIARDSGYKTLKESCVDLVNNGVTTIEEVKRIINVID